MNRVLVYTIDSDFSGKKLIAFLRGKLKMSARLVSRLKAQPNGLILNGSHIRTIDKVFEGDKLTVTMPPEHGSVNPAGDYTPDILYEDSDILIINKPSGLAMHPTHNHQGDTLANAVSSYFAKKGENPVFRAVGRLDKCTSGIVICALNAHSAARLSGNYTKRYIAVADGEFTGCGVIDKPIYRPDPGKTLRAAGEDGEKAVTEWKSLGTNGKLSVLSVTPVTGRTHQIRVHFASLGTPLAGDDMYGSQNKEIDRAALHCYEVSFFHPVSGAQMFFTAPLPNDIKKLINDAFLNKQAEVLSKNEKFVEKLSIFT